MVKLNLENNKYISNGGVPYTQEEVDFLEELYIKQDQPLHMVLKAINDRFWKGREVRTYRGLEGKLSTLGIKKREHSSYSCGHLTSKSREIYRLKRAGKSYTQISKLLKVPLGSVKSVINYIKHKTLMNEVNTLKQQKLNKDSELQDLAGREELLRRNELLQRQLERAQALNTIITDTVKETIMKMPPVKVPEVIIRKGMHKPETAMLLLSDTHVGSEIVKEDVANITEYNFKIFQQRMDVLMQGIVECIDIQRSKIPIDNLNIDIVGDLVEGENIYVGQNRNIDLPLIQQTMEAANNICNKLLVPSCKLFKTVRVNCVWGNHSRPMRPGDFSPKTNFDYIAYMFMYERMKAQPNLKFYIADCPLMLYKLPEAPNFTHLISHGNEVNSWMSVPFYGLERDHGRYVQLFGMAINYWRLGHHHTSAKIDIPYGERIVNGAFPGGSELSVFKMKTMSQPKQLLFGFNATRGMTWRYEIQLAERKMLQADTNGIFTPTFKEKTQ